MIRGPGFVIVLAGLSASALAASALAAAQPAPKTRPVVSAGQVLAQRHCGGCHAVAEGPSPYADAPPFATLHHRYRPGCLEVMLSEGMLAPQRPPEEGGVRRHPRMPLATFDDDERASLTAYLRGLDPRPDPPAAVCEPLPRI